MRVLTALGTSADQDLAPSGYPIGVFGQSRNRGFGISPRPCSTMGVEHGFGVIGYK
jgi:hypothetical protein